MISILGGVLLGILIWYVSWRWRRRDPRRLVAADRPTDRARWTLRDPELNLVSVSDHIFETTDADGRAVLYPHELKPSRRAQQPYPSDILQLGVSMAGLRARTRVRFAGFGVLEYHGGRQFRVEWTDELARQLQDATARVRALRASRTAPPRTHESRRICSYCPVAESCDVRLR